jgi:hypothetical protein
VEPQRVPQVRMIWLLGKGMSCSLRRVCVRSQSAF